jgi:hypothetical protein
MSHKGRHGEANRCIFGNFSLRTGQRGKQNRVPRTQKAYFKQIFPVTCLFLNPKGGGRLFLEKSVYFNRTIRRQVQEYSTLHVSDRSLTVSYRMCTCETVLRATGYGLDGPSSIPGRAKISLLHSVQTCFGAHTASYPMDTEGEFPGGLSGRGVKLTAHLHLVPRSRMVELHLHSSMSSWRGA